MNDLMSNAIESSVKLGKLSFRDISFFNPSNFGNITGE